MESFDENKPMGVPLKKKEEIHQGIHDKRRWGVSSVPFPF
jgi:hypothetical protein